MKKVLLLLAGFLATVAVSAQSLQVSNANTSLSGASNYLLNGHATITNTGSNTLNIRVKRIQNDLATGHTSYFCWGTFCYPSTTNQSTNASIVYIAPGESDTSFRGYLQPSNNVGSSTVTYVFFDDDNPNDSVAITYYYTAVGLDEITSAKYLSVASPNPADGYTMISYSNAARNSRLVITNLLGMTVKEIVLNDKQNSIMIPTSDLRPGIYMYSLLQDGRFVASRRLVVTHR